MLLEAYYIIYYTEYTLGFQQLYTKNNNQKKSNIFYSERKKKDMKLKRVGKILLIVVLILALILGSGFAYLYFNGMSGVTSQVAELEAGQIRVACVGDSITYGHGIIGWPDNNYPAVLQKLLGEDYHVSNFGVSSFAVQDTADRPYATLTQYQDSLAYDADYVIFMMGSNDSKAENWISDVSYREDLISLLDSYGQTNIILCTIPAAFFLNGQTEGATSHDIQPLVVDQISDVIRQVAAERRYSLLDIHALSSQNPQWFEKDGVHPNNDGAAAIAQEVFTLLTAEAG